jgi:hypothetical protein
MPTKRERLEEFFRRLAAAPAARDHEEAFELIRRILTEVEDELSGIPENPHPPLKSTEDRMYPPRADNIFDLPEAPGVKRLRSAGHMTFVGLNGAIDIRTLDGELEFTKPGADGRSIEVS